MTRLSALAALTLAAAAPAAEPPSDWVPLFNGKDLTGWTPNEKPECFRVVDGELALQGGMAHLFYTGPVANHRFKNFEFSCEVKTAPGANSGVFFHTENRGPGALKKGYEAQVNTSYVKDPRKTGSLVDVVDLKESPVPDGAWYRYDIAVTGRHVVVKLNGKTAVDYTQEEKPVRKKGREERILSSGTFALQAHDPNSRTWFRDIKVKVLPD